MIKDNIRRLMQEQGYTIVSLSNRCGWSTSAITRWRTGKITPSKSAVNELAKVFGVSADEIYGKDK